MRLRRLIDWFLPEPEPIRWSALMTPELAVASLPWPSGLPADQRLDYARWLSNMTATEMPIQVVWELHARGYSKLQPLAEAFGLTQADFTFAISGDQLPWDRPSPLKAPDPNGYQLSRYIIDVSRW